MTKIIYPKSDIINFLEIKLINTKYFILDNWMFVHVLSGMILALIGKYTKFDIFSKWYVVLFALILWELFEILMRVFFVGGENIVNIIWDIIFGMIGWLIIMYLFK